MADGTEVAKAFVTVIPTMQGAQKAITNGLTGAMTSAAPAAGQAAGTAAATGMAATLSKFVAPAAVIAAFVALGKQCADSFAAVEEGQNNLLIATGATGEQARELEAVYKEVAQNVVGDFGDIGAAVGELNTRFGLTGDQLEVASEQTMQYAKVTGTDAVTAVQSVSRMMNNAGIDASEYGATLDKLTVAAQQSGIDVTKLTESVTNNAASFRQLGFSTDEAIAMLANFEKAGVPAQAVLAGMKKGVAEWSKEGKSAAEGFADFVQGVQDGSVSAADAIEIFGARAGTQMYDAAKNGQLDFDEMYAAITEGSEGALDSVYNDTLTLSDKLGIIKNNFMEAGAAVAEPLVDAVSAGLTAVLPLVQSFADGVSSFIDTLSVSMAPAAEALQSMFNGIMESGAASALLESVGNALSTIATTIGSVLTPVIQILSPIISTLFEAWALGMSVVLDLFSGLVTEIVSAVMPYIQQLADLIAPYLEKFKTWFEENLPTIKETVTNVINGIMSVISVVLPVIVGIVTGAVGAIKAVIGTIQTIVGVVQGVFNAVKTAITNPIETAKNTLKTIIDKIKSIFSGLKLELPHPKMPHFSVSGGKAPWGIGGMGEMPKFNIEWYAQGGIFTSPQIIGVGEAGTEVVMPLSRLESMFEPGGGDTYIIQNIDFTGDTDVEAAMLTIFDKMKRLGAM